MKILAVCGLGIGTSLILKMNIETVLRDLGIKANVEHMDVSAAKTAHADLIITSSELAATLGEHPAKVLIVNNYFDSEEIKSVLSEI
jgi:ascorbate PTS system EIIB component